MELFKINHIKLSIIAKHNLVKPKIAMTHAYMMLTAMKSLEEMIYSVNKLIIMLKDTN